MPTLELLGEHIPYQLERTGKARAKIYFPNHFPLLHIETHDGKWHAEVEAFIQKKAKWIVKHYRTCQELQTKREEFVSEMQANRMLYTGQYQEVEIIPYKKQEIRITEQGRIQLLGADRWDGSKEELWYAALRGLASSKLRHKTHYWAQQTQSAINSIRIKDHKSKWGSCSSLRNVNLNWHLICLDESLIDYVIIHELMHLREMNHSPQFWQQVEQYFPDYQQARKQLKAQQWIIGIFNLMIPANLDAKSSSNSKT